MSLMNALNFINGVFVLVGVPTLIGALVYIGRKVQILDTLSADMDALKHNIRVVTAYLIRHHPEFDHRELKN